MPRWLLKPKFPSDFAEKFPGYGSEILQLLYDRGLDTQEKIDEFLKPDFSQDIHDPFLFKDMVKAVERINLAIENQEKILKSLWPGKVTCVLKRKKSKLYGIDKKTIALRVPNYKLLNNGMDVTEQRE